MNNMFRFVTHQVCPNCKGKGFVKNNNSLVERDCPTCSCMGYVDSGYSQLLPDFFLKNNKEEILQLVERERFL
ncbi:MAG: hypothetical protein PHZ25_04035 [Candidatus Pacebacteria bacterium]|nr:hypothetical protein [Candidatus Paceibacterota bacterium]